MAQGTDLMGHSMPFGLASLLGNDPALIAAAGSTQAGAKTISDNTYLVEFTATGADGIILPTKAKIGTPFFVINSSGSTGLVYVPVSQYLNTTQNGSLSMTTHTRAIFIQYKLNYWLSILSA